MLDNRVVRVWLCLCVVIPVILVGSDAVYGSLVSFDLSVEFSEATPPAGAAPWLNATFDDEDSAGSVVMTLTATNLSGVEKVKEWLFNLDPALNPASLVFSLPTKTGNFTAPAIDLAVNKFKATGKRHFDIKFTFDFSGTPDERFDAGDAVQYTITGISSLTSASFDFLNHGGNGDCFPTAAHVQGIGAKGDDSGWTTTPEPTTMGLLLLGGMALLRRRKKQ